MLVVYKTGAIRVTPKFTRFIVAAMFGVLALMLGNLVLAMFGVGGGEGLGLRSGGRLPSSSRWSASALRRSRSSSTSTRPIG